MKLVPRFVDNELVYVVTGFGPRAGLAYSEEDMHTRAKRGRGPRGNTLLLIDKHEYEIAGPLLEAVENDFDWAWLVAAEQSAQMHYNARCVLPRAPEPAFPTVEKALCPRCSAPAYVGIFSVDCSRKCA
jgi:hypothetical protein